MTRFCRVEQRPARLVHTQEVAGSNPAPATSSRSFDAAARCRHVLPGRSTDGRAGSRSRRGHLFALQRSLAENGVVASPRAP